MMLPQDIINLLTTGFIWPRLRAKVLQNSLQKFLMETEANATHTWFHTPNSISSFLNESRNEEMKLRWGKNYIPVPLG